MTTRTRSSTEHFLIGQGQGKMPPSQLPSGLDVLREILWKTESDESDIESSISCEVSRGTYEINCNKDKEGCGCLLKDDPNLQCTVRKILEIYKRAAIPTTRNDKIQGKCFKLFNSYKELRKQRNVKTPSANKKRERFLEELRPAFTAYHAQAEDIINADPQRSAETKKEDIAFLLDQKSKREARIDSTADKIYTSKVVEDKMKQERKRKRVSDIERRVEQEKKARAERMSTVNLDFDLVTFASSSSNNNNNLDEDQEYVAPSSPAPETPREKKRKKKKCGQTVHIPPNILELCVPEGTRSKLTNGQQVSYLSGVLNALGCNLDNFHMSHSSADRYTKKVKGKLAQKIRDNFQKGVKEKRARLVIHYDGKLVHELDRHKVKRKKKDRLAIIARSPDLPDGGEQLLGIPELQSGSGLKQTEAILALTDNLKEHIIASSQDTCGTNTGTKKGVVVRLSKHLNVPLLRLDCRRHTVELRVKHYAEIISGRATTASGDMFFSRYREGFDSIRDSIDYDKLVTFNWPADDDSFLSKKATEALKMVEKYLVDNTFARGDYRDLCEAVYVFLSGEKTIKGKGKPYKIPKPHKVSHARFMQRGLNYLPMKMLGVQADYMRLSEREELEVEVMSTFIALFYTPWFLQSSLTAEAAALDIIAIQDMRELKEITLKEFNEDQQNIEKELKYTAAKKCLENMYAHGDYLTEANIVFGLAGKKMTEVMKKELAEEIFNLISDPDTDTETFTYTDEHDERFDITTVWPEGQQPDLRKFVGRNSLLAFFHLRMLDPHNMEWLLLPPAEWEMNPQYEEFQAFIKSMECVNDCAER